MQEEEVPVFPHTGRNVLRAKWPSVSIAESEAAAAQFAWLWNYCPETKSDLLLPDNRNHSINTFMTIIKLLNQTAVENVTRLLSYYASSIVTMFHDLEEVTTNALRFNDIGLITIRLPSQATEKDIEMDSTRTEGEALIVLGQLLLLPYKNVTPENYLSFSNRHIRAMRSFIGVTSTEQQLLAIADVEKFNVIRSVFGHIPFRQALLRRIISGCSERYPFGDFYTYLSETLAWTDMSVFPAIADTLLELASPVLKDPRVSVEVRALAEALYVITQFEYPQYYRILGPARGRFMLERGKFPILAAVAQKLKSEEYSVPSEFAATTIIHGNHPIVVELINIHKEYMKHLKHRTIPPNNAAHNFLSTVRLVPVSPVSQSSGGPGRHRSTSMETMPNSNGS